MAVGCGRFGQLCSSSAGRISRLTGLLPIQDADNVTDSPAPKDASEPRSSSSAVLQNERHKKIPSSRLREDEVYDVVDKRWRVRYLDIGWEELTRQEMESFVRRG